MLSITWLWSWSCLNSTTICKIFENFPTVIVFPKFVVPVMNYKLLFCFFATLANVDQQGKDEFQTSYGSDLLHGDYMTLCDQQ